MVEFIFIAVAFGVGLFIGKLYFPSGKELEEIKQAEAELDAKLTRFNELDKQLAERENKLLLAEVSPERKKTSAKQSKK